MKTLIRVGFLFIFLISCSTINSATTPPTSDVLSTETASVSPVALQNELKVIWESSSHARATEPVKCESCHEVQNGLVLARAGGPEQPTSSGSTGLNGDAPCAQCHEGTVAGNAHPGYTCTRCHDPHSTVASCTDSGCHSTLTQTVVHEIPPTPTDGHPKTGSSFCGGANCHSAATAVAKSAFSIHGSYHARVSCVACHTASGMQAGPAPDGSAWVLLQAVNTEGSVSFEPAFSHEIQLEVSCTACHFENNLWGLDLVSGDEFGR